MLTIALLLSLSNAPELTPSTTAKPVERVCMNPFVERGALEMALPEWAFVPHSHQQECGPTENAETIMLEMGLNPFDKVEREPEIDLGRGDVIAAAI